MSRDDTDLLHDRSRLAIVSLLATSSSDELPFTFIQEKTGLTAGNLSSHLRTLENAGLVSLTKQFQGRRPLTTIVLTSTGRTTFDAFIREMESLIRGYRE
ncbi:transcriptional regulator [Alkalispirochaeta sphaeroplastigenens]|uniref:transcriptional regulator n=1 Tax=Alkalispirochaeta sphaeroplastigenens TaxID=1187066 RepID=UPI0015E15F59